MAFPTMVSNNEESVYSIQEGGHVSNTNKGIDNTTQELMESPRQVDYNLEGPIEMETPTVIQDEEEWQQDNVAAEFLRIHQRMGNISLRRIQQMVKDGTLPKRLATCNVSVCTSCMYGKATKRP